MFRKHLRLTLDIKINFLERIKKITQKNSKTMGLLRKFQTNFAKIVSTYYR